MHFFYLDESGDTGTDLSNTQQPIFVLGGISVRDKGWNKTQDKLFKIFDNYFDDLPDEFELHTHELLSPNGEGVFEGHPIAERLELAISILDLIVELKHGIHYWAVEKSTLSDNNRIINQHYNNKVPYLLSFDYLATYLNWFVKDKLGSTARGMLIFDNKTQYHDGIEKIMHCRRFQGAKAKRIKWLVEFGYALDSKKNPMIQLSDFVVFVIRRFLEIEHGYKGGTPDVVKSFYATCFKTIHGKLSKKSVIERSGNTFNELNQFLKEVQCKPRLQWKQHYNLNFTINDIDT